MLLKNITNNSLIDVETDILVADSVTHLVTELRNNYGRSGAIRMRKMALYSRLLAQGTALMVV